MRRFATTALVVGAFLYAASAGAQTVVRGGTIHPVEGESIEEGVVVIGQDGRIDAVGGSDTSVPEGAEVIDASGNVVTPGLIDANTHLGLVEVWAVDETRDDDRGGSDPVRAAFRTADGFAPGSSAIPVARTGGVTSVVTVPNGGLVSGQSAWVDLRGSDTGYATVIETSTAMHVQYRAPEKTGSDIDGVESRAGLMEKLRELYDDVEFFADNRDAYDANESRTLAASRLDLEALTKTLDRTWPVAFETHRASDIERVLELSDSYGLDPILFGGAEAWKLADRLAAERVPVVVQPTSNLPSAFETLEARTDSAVILAEAGVPVVLSTFGTHNVRRLRQMAGIAVRAGMDHAEALEAVTLHPAEAFGMADQYGSLEKDKIGNVVVWSGDPFELSTGVESMVIRGKSVSLETRQDELFERYRELDRRGEPADE